MKDCRYEKPEFVITADDINERTKYINLEINRRVESTLHGIEREHRDTKSEVKRLKKALNAVCAAYAANTAVFAALILWFGS